MDRNLCEADMRSLAWEEKKIILSKDGTGPERIFKEIYGDSENFMTPIIIGYGTISPFKNIVYKLSEGTDFNHKAIWGVSVCDLKGKRPDDSKGGFYDYLDALDYIKELIKKYQEEC